MKKALTLIFTVVMTIAALPAIAQTLIPQNKETATFKSRKVYCVGTNYPGWDKSYGISTFETSDPSKFELVQDFSFTQIGGGRSAVFCGAAADDVYYAYFYKYNINAGPEPFCIATVNIRNGEIKKIVDFKLNMEIPKFYDMSYDYTTKTMYGTAFVGGRHQLYKIDLKNGTLTPDIVIEEGSRVSSIAFSMDGQLYGCSNNGDLLKVNKTDGTTTKVMSTGIKSMLWTCLEFDHTDGTLYGACFQTPGPVNMEVTQGTAIVRFDLKNKRFETLGKIEGAKVFGLYIPYLKSGFNAPGVPTNIKAIVGEKGAEKATVSWKNPVKTYGQDELTAISMIKVLRDGEEMATFTNATPGQTMSWEDNTVKTGAHIYSIYAVNTTGDGEFGKIDCFVGKDTPGEVKEISLRVNKGYDNSTLTWKVPTNGAREGYFDTEGLTYTVVRYPDSVIVAKDIQELTYTDTNIKRLALYYYSVTASNASGQGLEAYSYQSIIGKPKEVPYNTFFENQAEIQNSWSGSDYNQDGNSWIFNLGIGHSVFGSSDMAAEYIAVNNQTDANDWLISPPFNLKNGIKYSLSFDTRSIGRDSLVISLLTIDDPRRDFKNVTVEGKSPAKGKVAPWITTQLDLPADIQAGAYSIGIKLATPFGNSSYIQLSNFTLAEATGIVSDSADSDINVISMDGLLTIYGDFSSAEVFNTAGWRMGHTESGNPSISSSGWNSGVYFVRVTRGETSNVYKVFVK